MPRFAPLSALLALAACGGGDADLNAAYFGKSVEPPRDLAKLRIGMTQDEAKAAAPSLKEGTGINEGDWLLPSGTKKVILEADFDEDRIDRLVVRARTLDLEKMLTEAWGAPTRVADRYSNDEVPTWFNADKGWRAELFCMERSCVVEFERHAPLTADFFGKAPSPPGEYAKVRAGMTVEEAKAILPDDAALEKYVDLGPDDVGITVQNVGENKAVSGMNMMLPPAAKELVTKAWGPGAAIKDRIERPLTVWHDPATGWRATWEDSTVGDRATLNFSNYLPLAQLLGDSGDDLAALPGVLGLTKEELAAKFPTQWRADDAVIELFPTEWGEHWTRVNVYYDDAGKARAYIVSIPYAGHPTAKDDILAAFQKRWGAPTPGEEYGQAFLTFRPTAPKVVVKDQTITGEWQITFGEY